MMADSEEKKDETTSQALIIKGKAREILRNSDGQFTKRPAKTIDRKKQAEIILKEITRPVKGPDGKIDKKVKNRLQKGWDNALEFIADELVWKDPDLAKTAHKILMDATTRLVGKPQPSEEELDALKLSGIKKIVIVQPSGLPEEDGDKPRPKLQPPTITAEIIKEGE